MRPDLRNSVSPFYRGIAGLTEVSLSGMPEA